MHQQQHYTLFKMKKVKLQSTTPLGDQIIDFRGTINEDFFFNKNSLISILLGYFLQFVP